MKDLIFGLVFIALGITVWVLASDFPAVPGMHYGANLFPSIIATGMIVGGALLSTLTLRKMRQASTNEGGGSGFALPSAGLLVPCLMVVAYIYLSEVLGAALSMLLIMLVLLFQGGVRWLPALLISSISTAVISLSFGHMLKVPLPIGPFGF
jgi:putative tricarboxylic transport membrane protein